MGNLDCLPLIFRISDFSTPTPIPCSFSLRQGSEPCRKENEMRPRLSSLWAHETIYIRWRRD